MDEIEFVENFKILKLQENDLIIVRTKYRISKYIAENMKKIIMDNLPDPFKGKVKVFILEDGMDIEVLRGELK